ncbi:Cysteine/Histidine-rich C1 domain family protein, putative [Theobroma cacao]|uniref:Cysteine/Histidine-rich C1 domain family protein, putative n=1 Tax=Theobroma cacao TaxID=3641 RepID=A0A061F982_THECC|nr:Cysteine/Histidine-rich C1 domain family protein, putative [Theobroma cacao]
MQIQHFNHHHPLNFHEVHKEDENLGCKACKLEIHGPAYICKECGYYLHKACTELPNEVLHPLHPQHALNLLTRSPNTRHFICDECGDISDGFLYFCCECHFKVDVKCAGLSAPSNQGQRQKEMARKTKISHFSHDHMLVLGSAKKDYYCSYCQLEIFGLAYCCLDCNDIYVLRESCLEFPEKMQHPFHPLHPLMAKMFLTESCHACDFRFVGISYSCLECDLHLHPTCLNSMRRALKFNLRTCKLDFFYFGIGCQMLFNGYTCLRCDETGAGPFCFCIEANISLHLECFPIPQMVKSTHHSHPLVLKNSFVEDDTGEYYCDICEEERFAKYHIYYCEECQDMFVTHLECVLFEVNSYMTYVFI